MIVNLSPDQRKDSISDISKFTFIMIKSHKNQMTMDLLYTDWAANANNFAENHIKIFQSVVELCYLKVSRTFFTSENNLIAINRNITHNAIFIFNNAKFCDVI